MKAIQSTLSLGRFTTKRILVVACFAILGTCALFIFYVKTLSKYSISLSIEEKHQKYEKKALMVEPFYKTNAIHFVLENALERLPSDWQVVAYMPLAAKDFFENLCKGTAKQKSSKRFQDACISGRFVHQIMPEQDFAAGKSPYANDHWRNVMFNNKTWWESFDAKWILGIQTDTIICRNGEPPLKYGYIGGASNPDVKFFRDTKLDFEGHMNGGFSLRNVEWTVKCLETRPEAKMEDGKFSDCYRDDKVKNRIPFIEVSSFASDNGWTGCFDGPWGSRVCPYGLHKPWTRVGFFHGYLKFEEHIEMLNACPGAGMLEFFNHGRNFD